MRKLTSTLLLITTLFANLSWAMDTHAEAFFGHGTEHSEAQSPAHEPQGDDHSSDHCCHGLAHLSGLSLRINLTYESFPDSYIASSVDYYSTRSQAPPTPPPNA